ncbi:cytochrome P450 [Echria macrotheca]|uniref:Cytochrome P450 n=1 Tax=Echria macrotheca TaxID=438768 RepID=A0AAJ0B662_9PEZI|nr:cytochrome P450 [Echria macrotheca]
MSSITISTTWGYPDLLYLAAACVGLLLLSLIILTAYNIFLHPLSAYPGPIHYRASNIPWLIQEWRGNTVHKWADLHDRYGEVVRIAPNQLSYISVGAWRDIYGARGTAESSSSTVPTQMLKEELEFPGDDFEFFAPAKPMISCDPHSHARHRRAVAPAFSERALRSFEPTIVRFTDDMLDRLEEKQRSLQEETEQPGAAINLMDWFHFVMFDITSALVFGRPFGNLKQGRYHPWVGRIFPGMKLIAWSLVIAAIPGLGRILASLLPRKIVDEARRHMQSIVDMTDARCHAQETNPPPHADFMSYILPNMAASQKGKDTSLSAEELYLNAQLLCIAGSETTASLLAGAVHFLSRPENQHHKKRLVAELHTQFASEGDITPTSLGQRAPFLAAVLNECLRLYPPGAINMPRTVPRGGATIDGRYVPAGSVVGIAQFAAYRSSRHWVDPLTFAPERWLPADPASNRYAADRREVFKPFSYGPRNCVGQSLAIAECRLIVAKLFRRFDVQVLPGQEGWIRQKTFLSWEKPPLMVHIQTERTHHT